MQNVNNLFSRTTKIGQGAYGEIYLARDNKNSRSVVIKRHLIQREIDFIGSIRELDILARLHGHPMIVNLTAITIGNPFRMSPVHSPSKKNDQVNFVFQHSRGDLSQFIKQLDYQTIKIVMAEILLAIEYLHSKKFMHLDIKPENILIDNGHAKICDFGLSKPYTAQEGHPLGIVTCWYRAPEICLQYDKYDYKADIWSIGCLFFEMISNNPLLYGIKDDDDYAIINRIWQLLPVQPSLETLENYNVYKIVLRSTCRRKSWDQRINLASHKKALFDSRDGKYTDFLNLLDQLLQFDPSKRPTATQALNHSFFNSYKDMIKDIRDCYQPVADKIEVTLPDRIEKFWVLNLAIFIYHQRGSLNWYTHRILFQAVDLFIRYLELNNDTLSQIVIVKRFMVCLYISIKYFSILVDSFGFFEIIPHQLHNNRFKGEAKKFEYYLIKALDNRIYRPTLYEIADNFAYQLTESDIGKALFFYRDYNTEKIGLENLFLIYKSML